MIKFNPDKELYKIQHGNKNKILYCIIVLLLIISIGSTYALYQVRYSKRIIYTKVAPFSNHDLELSVYIDDTKVTDFPENVGYQYIFDYIKCEKDNITTAKWDIEQGGLSVLTKGPNKCDIYFTEKLEVEFPYVGEKITEYVITRTGNYKLEVWGAQGGSSSCSGGMGGYSSGEVELKSGDKLYIVVGGTGKGNGSHSFQSGGYNGGGDAISNGDSNSRQASGGGATHIALVDGELSTLSQQTDKILIVAGGGGGAGANAAIMCTNGGSGGGLNGGNGGTYIENGIFICTGYGGTQNGGGSFACNSDWGKGNGTFGQGYSTQYAGGGGGWYGGGVGHSSAGGGSGYLNPKLSNAVTEGGKQAGNGKAMITYIGAGS